MRALRVEIDPFTFTDILDVKIHKGANKLGSAWIKGVIAENMEDKYIQMSLRDTPIKITVIGFNGDHQVIFQGVLENLNISSVNDLKVMELSVMSYSALLNVNPGIKVFQNKDLKYNKMISAVLAPFKDAAAIIHCGDGQAIGQMFIQYQETAWAFIKRMASMFNDVIVSDDTLKGAKLHFGFLCKRTSNQQPVNPISYDMRKSAASYLKKDKACYVVKEREVRELGEPVVFKGQQLYITNVESFFEGGELIHLYTLMERGGIWTAPYRNFAIVGASLSGQVSAVSGSHVKMKLPTAHSNDTNTSKWHAFSTVYSSPDGTGWYAMPEKGDSLRLYFPTEIENEGYTISAVHTYGAPQTTGMAAKATGSTGAKSAGGSGSQPSAAAAAPNPEVPPAVAPDSEDPAAEEPERFDAEQFSAVMGSLTNAEMRGRASSLVESAFGQAAEINPDVKFLQNSSGKFVMLTPSAIMMASEGGVILIEDGQGITICSNSDVYIGGSDVTVASSGQIAVIGDSEVVVQQDSAMAKLSGGNVTFDAAEIKTV